MPACTSTISAIGPPSPSRPRIGRRGTAITGARIKKPRFLIRPGVEGRTVVAPRGIGDRTGATQGQVGSEGRATRRGTRWQRLPTETPPLGAGSGLAHLQGEDTP